MYMKDILKINDIILTLIYLPRHTLSFTVVSPLYWYIVDEISNKLESTIKRDCTQSF